MVGRCFKHDSRGGGVTQIVRSLEAHGKGKYQIRYKYFNTWSSAYKYTSAERTFLEDALTTNEVPVPQGWTLTMYCPNCEREMAKNPDDYICVECRAGLC